MKLFIYLFITFIKDMANMASTLKALNSLGFKLPEALARPGSSGKLYPRPVRNKNSSAK